MGRAIPAEEAERMVSTLARLWRAWLNAGVRIEDEQNVREARYVDKAEP